MLISLVDDLLLIILENLKLSQLVRLMMINKRFYFLIKRNYQKESFKLYLDKGEYSDKIALVDKSSFNFYSTQFANQTKFFKLSWKVDIKEFKKLINEFNRNKSNAYYDFFVDRKETSHKIVEERFKFSDGFLFSLSIAKINLVVKSELRKMN